MNLKLSITTALIALTTFPAFAKMERLGINQPALGPIVGVGLGYLTLGGGFYAARHGAVLASYITPTNPQIGINRRCKVYH